MITVPNPNLSLFKSFLNEIIEDKETTYLCLISNTPLDKNHIKLDCGHEFNYLPLHAEVVQQKVKRLQDNSRLRLNQIKCPYCRGITNKLLPFYKYYDVSLQKGVNYPVALCMKTYECEYIVKKTKVKCDQSACITMHGTFCNKHFKYKKKYEEQIAVVVEDNKDKITEYKKKTVKELREILRGFGKTMSGKKDELIERILCN